MNVLFWERCDFPISFWGRNMSWNAWNRTTSTKFYGRYCDFVKQYDVSLSWMSSIMKHDHMHWDIPMIKPLLDLVTEYEYDLHAKFGEVSKGHLQRMRYADRGATCIPSRHVVLSLSELAYLLMLRPVILSCRVSGLLVSGVPRYFYNFTPNENSSV